MAGTTTAAMIATDMNSVSPNKNHKNNTRLLLHSPTSKTHHPHHPPPPPPPYWLSALIVNTTTTTALPNLSSPSGDSGTVARTLAGGGPMGHTATTSESHCSCCHCGGSGSCACGGGGGIPSPAGVQETLRRMRDWPLDLQQQQQNHQQQHFLSNCSMNDQEPCDGPEHPTYTAVSPPSSSSSSPRNHHHHSTAATRPPDAAPAPQPPASLRRDGPPDRFIMIQMPPPEPEAGPLSASLLLALWQEARVEIAHKDDYIRQLQQQVQSLQQQQQQKLEQQQQQQQMNCPRDSLRENVAEGNDHAEDDAADDDDDDDDDPKREGPSSHGPLSTFPSPGRPNDSDTPPLPIHTMDGVHHAVQQILQWLFLQGGHFTDLKSMLVQYGPLLRDQLKMPVDRVFVGGLMLHPQVSGYTWKWQFDQPFEEREIPRKIFEDRRRTIGKDEPFIRLEFGAPFVRMKATDEFIPPDCAWFRQEGFHDYLAWPLWYRGKFNGGMAWATKSPQGFSPEQIAIFQEHVAALSTVVRLHTNDLVMKTLMGRLEEEVSERTRELAVANVHLAEAHRNVKMQAQAQLRHFAMMSHEIRTPLNCIVGISNLLIESPLDAVQQRESLQMIVDSGDLLLAVVDDVLNYSKLAAGKMVIEHKRTDLKRCLHSVVKSVGIKARSEQLELRYQYDEEHLPPYILTDGRRLQQVLYNLLGNAVKFGREGHFVDFSVRLVTDVKAVHHHHHPPPPDDDDEEQKPDAAVTAITKPRIQFSVKDYGKGIKEHDMENIFQPFQQGTADTEKLFGGTGLGLAITSKLVKGLGGTIDVDSVFGSWAEFVVELPVDQVPSRGSEHNHALLLAEELDSFSENEDSGTNSSSDSGDVPLVDEECESLTPEIHQRTLPPTDVALKTAATEAFTKRVFPRSRSKIKDLLDDDEKDNALLLPSYANMKVLIAEDNPINQKVLSRSLSRLGLGTIDIVDDGRKAVNATASTLYDVVFMDLQMPVMDGLEATKMITQRDRLVAGGHIPRIIFVTAHALDEFQTHAMDSGADGFVTKPFKIDKIDSLLQSMGFVKEDRPPGVP